MKLGRRKSAQKDKRLMEGQGLTKTKTLQPPGERKKARKRLRHVPLTCENLGLEALPFARLAKGEGRRSVTTTALFSGARRLLIPTLLSSQGRIGMQKRAEQSRDSARWLIGSPVLPGGDVGLPRQQRGKSETTPFLDAAV
jgi:hypothetical protein